MKRFIINSLALSITCLSLAGCNKGNVNTEGSKVHLEAEEKQNNVLRILNCEDYIYEKDVTDPESEEGLLDQFVEYIKETEEGREIEVIYDTFDTNETMFNELKTGKTTYDIIVPSDYMIQKLITLDMLEKIDPSIEMPNYDAYGSPYVKNIFEGITAVNNVTNTTEKLSDYTVAYMWGTVGLVYNPTYYKYQERGYDEDKIHEDFLDFETSLYNEDYKNTISIKDSVRDVYAVSVIHVYQEEILGYQEKLDNGEITIEQYQVKLDEIFNRNDNETIAKVQADLLKLKDNAFGFEVDSGKNDIVTGKIGGNIAWSGDAVYAIELGEADTLDDEDETEKESIELYYSIPKIGSNIWFDGMCMPKSNSLNKELAQKFMDFLYNPDKAALNMDGTGYTPGVAGDAMLNQIYDYYDVRGVDEEGERVLDVDPNWVEDEDYVKYDLSYFFEGTIDNIEEAILYADPDSVGRDLTAQFPEEELLPYLAVMKDFGSQNTAILDMWEIVKTNYLPVWGIILFSVEGAVAVGAVVYFGVAKAQKKNLRKKRKEAK